VGHTHLRIVDEAGPDLALVLPRARPAHHGLDRFARYDHIVEVQRQGPLLEPPLAIYIQHRRDEAVQMAGAGHRRAAESESASPVGVMNAARGEIQRHPWRPEHHLVVGVHMTAHDLTLLNS
jgi:hypothetical protein